VIVYTATHRATITFGTSGQPSQVAQDAGRLGDTITAAWHAWQHHGRPDRTRIGVTAYANGTHAWFDTPDGPHQWPLPA
jgi:hypothetical protein